MRRIIALVAGSVFILFGAILLAAQFLDMPVNAALWLGVGGLLLMGAALLAYYADSQMVAALVPGCILVGLAAGILLADLLPALDILFILGGMGVAFFAIQVVDRRVAGRSQNWAAIPGVLLLALGIILATVDFAPGTYEPLIVIGGIGVALMATALATRTRGLLMGGGLLLGIGAGVFAVEALEIEGLASAGIIIGGIGLGYIIASIVNRLAHPSARAWSVAPAVVFLVLGAVFYFAGRTGAEAEAATILNGVWGGLLVLAGLWLVIRLLVGRRS